MGRAGFWSSNPANLASPTMPTIRNVPASSGTSKSEVMIDGIFVIFEEAFDEGLIHHGDRRGGFIVCRGEIAATDQGNTEILQIVGADAIPRRSGLLVELCREDDRRP